MRDLIAEQARILGQRVLHPFKSSLYAGSDAVEEFWALKDISLEIKRGDSVGIVGRNGAGKSTLLKVLSRITEPTTGRIEIEGRVASLLEVGTGFHSELTGRENIFLNGAILGMKRDEIRRKFDEIVAFAEVEKFLDTPVKRYSSGMYVRLAFAVAAHLEPEILIVDEVLAVGDTQFQKKCLGKMEEVGREGRTVLFVSHNMGAVQNLCNCAFLLDGGRVSDAGSVADVVSSYFKTRVVDSDVGENLMSVPRPGYLTGEVKFSRCRILNSKHEKCVRLKYNEPFSVSLEAMSQVKCEGLNLVVGVQTPSGLRVFTATSASEAVEFDVSPGRHLIVTVNFPALTLVPGLYQLYISIRSGGVHHDTLNLIEFEVVDQPFEGTSSHAGTLGLISTQAEWVS
jgi:lipopolysaccharide transport system ATP-binding protein